MLTSLAENRATITADAAPADERRPWYLGAAPLATRPWLVRVRWITAAIEALVVLVALFFPRADFPLDHLAPLMAIAATIHAAVAFRLQQGGTVAPLVAFASLAVDVLVVTGLMEITGGPFNPFSVLYVVHVVLAAVTIGRTPAWAIALLASASYGVLIVQHARELDPDHHRLNDFPTHLFTIWVAVATTAELVAHFVLKASAALSLREAELERMRARATRSERLVALTTLAAGAAHELSTPLATIALASRELEHAAAAAGGTRSALVDDARLIRAEVDRCQAILDQMSGRAGGIAADDPEPVDVAAAIAEAIARLPDERAARVHVDVAANLPALHVPRAGFTQVLLSLLTNAFDASPGHEPVLIAAGPSGPGALRLWVHDRGQPLTADVLSRAGEPFFTTKEPGRGLGLGLFLARVFAERSGGSLTLTSEHGTTAALELPLSAGREAGPR